jgi:hypothetical protein
MALWTPANLSVAPRLVMDGEAVPWSGSNYATTANSGSIGGNWNALQGTVVKGSLLNAFNTLSFDGTRNLKLSVQAAWSGDACFFAVLQNVVAVDGGLVSHDWPWPSSGWTVYPRMANAGGASGYTWSAGDTLVFGSGSDISTPGNGNWTIATTPLASGSAAHIFVGRAGVTGLVRTDGTIETEPARTTNRATAVDTGPRLDYYLGSTSEVAYNAPEYGNFQLAYLCVGVGFTDDDIERLEGWAAWRYNLVSLLPAGHTYKSAAPTFGVSSITGTLAVTSAKDTAAFAGSITETLGAVYLDPAKLGPTITLSNANLTATQTAAATGNVRATAHHSSGKYYYEFLVNAVTGNMQVGLCADALPLTEYLGQSSLLSIGVDETSGWLGATGTITAPGLIVGHTYGMAIDLSGSASGLGKAWCKDITAGGNWNANAGSDPVTGVGGALFFTTVPNIPPTITSGTSASVPENTTAVMTVTATDTG